MVWKILKGFGILAAAIILGAIAGMLVISSTNWQKGSHEEKLQASGKTLGQALVIYQPSVSNVSSRMAHQMAQGLSDSGYNVTMNYPGDKLSYKMSDFNIVVFGSAVYMGKPSTALTNYLSSLKDYSSAKIVLYSTGSMLNNQKEFKYMESALGGATPCKTIKFDAQKKTNDEAARDFGAGLVK